MRTEIIFIFLLFDVTVYADFERCLSKTNSNVVKRSTPAYDEINFQFNIRNMLYPFGYILVKSTSDVQKAIHCSQLCNIHLAIRSGRHSFEKYSFGNNNSWVIDLSSLKKIEVKEKETIAIIGAGNTLQSVTEFLWNNGRYFIPRGECSSVGISGYALGGGAGLTARKYGLLIDNIVGFEIVTAKAKILHVTCEKHPDLFWALKGAGAANFGVVTKFYVKLYDASYTTLWIIKVYNISHFAEVFEIWQQWVASNPDPSITSYFETPRMYSDILNVTFAIYNENITKSKQQVNLIISIFPNMTHADVCYGSYEKMRRATSRAAWRRTTTPRFYMKDKGFFVSKVLNHAEIEAMMDLLYDNAFVILFTMYGGKINEPKRTATAFVHRSSIYHARFGIDLKVGNKTIKETQILGERYEQRLKSLVQQLKYMSTCEQYQNYVDNDLVDWFDQYYKENGKRLKRIKRKFNPLNLFCYNQSIPLQ